MADLASSSGLPVPEIEDDGGAVTVRFRHGQFVPRSEDSEASPAQDMGEGPSAAGQCRGRADARRDSHPLGRWR